MSQWAPVRPEDIIIDDGQVKLAGREDLLQGVRGYCSAYQSLNMFSGRANFFGWSGVDKMLPFNAPLGPSKGAHVESNGIVFDEPGLWSVYVYVSADDSDDFLSAAQLDSFNVRAFIYDRVIENNADGAQIVDQLKYDDVSPAGSWKTVAFSFPTVIEKPGSYLMITTKLGHNRWWKGGTRYSRLSVVKHDNRPINPGKDTVPDE